MGVNITELLIKEPVAFSDLKNKTICIDSFNILYQFLTSIRMSDGSLLKDSHGNVTSHLTGLFNRTMSLLQKDIKLVYVFDGLPPLLKKAERERRASLKVEAENRYKLAVANQDYDSMKKYASRSTKLTGAIVEDAKKLVSLMGLPVVQAPSEGEAQASFIVSKGDAFAVGSQDSDSLLFGAKRVVKNLTLNPKRKLSNKFSYSTITPEILILSENLSKLGIDQDQLVVLGMLVGTDYNVGGIKGIGQKKAYSLVKKYDHNFDSLFKDVGWSNHFSFEWHDVFDLMRNMPCTQEYTLKFNNPDKEGIIDFLCEQHDFSRDRIEKILDDYYKQAAGNNQQNLNKWF